jgi:acyl carrier protein
MTRPEIVDGVKSLLARVSNPPRPKDSIKEAHKLKIYVNPVNALSLAVELVDTFPRLPKNELANKLFESIVSVKDLIDYIYEKYNT